MSEQEEEKEARYQLDCKKYGPLPRPIHFRKGPVDEENKPLDPERKWIAVYPDHTFPRPVKK